MPTWIRYYGPTFGLCLCMYFLGALMALWIQSGTRPCTSPELAACRQVRDVCNSILAGVPLRGDPAGFTAAFTLCNEANAASPQASPKSQPKPEAESFWDFDPTQPPDAIRSDPCRYVERVSTALQASEPFSQTEFHTDQVSWFVSAVLACNEDHADKAIEVIPK